MFEDTVSIRGHEHESSLAGTKGKRTLPTLEPTIFGTTGGSEKTVSLS